jgi:hypothetical protein
MDTSYAIINFAPQGSLVEMSPRSPLTEKCQSSVLQPDGSVRKADYVFYVDRKRIKKSERGEVVGFSVRSRSRLNRKISMLKKHHVPLFVTLTYHLEYPDDFKEYKKQLHNFYRRLMRAFPNCGSMWKMEFQKRGAVHFHLFLWGVSLEDARDFIPQAWHEIAGAGSVQHLQWHKGELENNHCVQEIKSWHGVTSYASKYFAKLDDGVRGGRVWGVRGSVPFSALVSFRVDMDTALEFRYFHAIEKMYKFKRLGFWTNDYHPKWLMFLECLLSQPPIPSEHDIGFDEDFENENYELCLDEVVYG